MEYFAGLDVSMEETHRLSISCARYPLRRSRPLTHTSIVIGAKGPARKIIDGAAPPFSDEIKAVCRRASCEMLVRQTRSTTGFVNLSKFKHFLVPFRIGTDRRNRDQLPASWTSSASNVRLPQALPKRSHSNPRSRWL